MATEYRDKHGNVIPPEHFDGDMPPPDEKMDKSKDSTYGRLKKHIAEQQQDKKGS